MEGMTMTEETSEAIRQADDDLLSLWSPDALFLRAFDDESDQLQIPWLSKEDPSPLNEICDTPGHKGPTVADRH